MSIIDEYFIEVIEVIFDRCSDITSDARSNDIWEALGGYVMVFVFDDGIQFSKQFPF
jgi:hypothetical protein